MPMQTDFWPDTFGICPDLYIWTVVGLSKKRVSASEKKAVWTRYLRKKLLLIGHFRENCLYICDWLWEKGHIRANNDFSV